jgi:hypothetical protein
MKFPSAAGSGGQLGQSISMSGDRVLAGGWVHDSPTEYEAGTTLLFSSGARCAAGLAFCACEGPGPCSSGFNLTSALRVDWVS